MRADNLLRKQALSPGVQGGLAAAETAGYFIPGVGGALSARDAGRNVVGMGKAIRNGNIKALGGQALRFAGNGLMAAADFVPVLGTWARGAIRGGMTASKVAKGVKGIRAANRAKDVADVSRSMKNMGNFGKKLNTSTRAGRILRDGSKALKNTDNFAALATKYKGLLESQKAALAAAKATGNPAAIRVAKKNLAAASKVSRQANRGAASSAGFRGVKGPGGVGNTISYTHGAINGQLARRMSPRQMEIMAQMSKHPWMSSYGKAQTRGIALTAPGMIADMRAETAAAVPYPQTMPQYAYPQRAYRAANMVRNNYR